jgi:hypothetical protein
VLGGGPENTAESGISFSAAWVLRTVGKLADDHIQAQDPLRPVVGGFYGGVFQESKHPALVVLQTDSIQQPLVILVLQTTMAQVMGELLVDPFGAGPKFLALPAWWSRHSWRP